MVIAVVAFIVVSAVVTFGGSAVLIAGLIGGYAGGFVENTVSGVFDAVKEKIKL